MKKVINNRLMTTTYYVSCACCIAFLISTISSPCVFAQGMGGGMMGMGRGMRANQNTQQANDAATPPKHQNPFAIDAPAIEGLEARTAALENFIFGSENKKLPIKKRVERLEKKLVPYEHPKPDDDLNVRIDHLWSTLAAANRASEKAPTPAQ